MKKDKVPFRGEFFVGESLMQPPECRAECQETPEVPGQAVLLTACPPGGPSSLAMR